MVVKSGRVLDPLELEFRVVVSSLAWVLGIEFGSSTRAVNAFHRRATSPALLGVTSW